MLELDVKRDRREKLFALRLTTQEHAALMELARESDLRMVEIVRRGINTVLQEREVGHEPHS